MPPATSPAAWLAAAEAAADAAGAILRHWFRADPPVEIKADSSPVTVADRQAEHAIRAVLADRHPDHAILGEEAGAAGHTDARYRWVIDPIDGTRAFVTGRPSFGTLIALLDDGVPILGLIDQPITGERWIGRAGQPTVFTGARGTPRTRRGRPLGACELSCTTPAMFAPADRPGFARLADRVGRVSYGGDCYVYGLLALGQIDIVAEADLKLWDWAALLPVVTGAGGSLTDWHGNPLRPDGDGRVLALGDPAHLNDAVAALAGTAGQETSP